MTVGRKVDGLVMFIARLVALWGQERPGAEGQKKRQATNTGEHDEGCGAGD
jgi:hypothetical protein